MEREDRGGDTIDDKNSRGEDEVHELASHGRIQNHASHHTAGELFAIPPQTQGHSSSVILLTKCLISRTVDRKISDGRYFHNSNAAC